MRIKTVVIDVDGSPVKINESDFDAKAHKLFKSAHVDAVEEGYDEQENLLAQLKEYGVIRDKRTSVDKLRELVAEEIAKANEKAGK